MLKRLISHRGNLNGRIIESENKPEHIEEVLKLGYDVEIDVWFKDGEFYLGHEEPQYHINRIFLMNEKLWCHAKNIEALYEMMHINHVHYFWHQNDDYTLTSRGIIWAYPGKKLTSNSICVLPELIQKDKYILNECLGVCSDYISEFL